MQAGKTPISSLTIHQLRRQIMVVVLFNGGQVVLLIFEAKQEYFITKNLKRKLAVFQIIYKMLSLE